MPIEPSEVPEPVDVPEDVASPESSPESPSPDSEAASRILSQHPEPEVRRVLSLALGYGLTADELHEGCSYPAFIPALHRLMLPRFMSMPERQKASTLRQLISLLREGVTADDQTAEKPQRRGKGRPRRGPSGENSGTLRRLLVLAVMFESGKGMSAGEISEKAGLSIDRLRIALRVLEKERLVEHSGKLGKTSLFQLTHQGTAHMIAGFHTTFVAYPLGKIPSRRYATNVVFGANVPTITKVISEGISVGKALRRLGWQYHCIRKVLLVHDTGYLLRQISKVEARNLENPGGYLMRTLLKLLPESQRRIDIEEKNLGGLLSSLDDALREVYRAETSTMSIAEARYLANALRRKAAKASLTGKQLIPGDIYQLATYIRKKRPRERKGRQEKN